MIHNQCRAYCQCEFCKNPAKPKAGDVSCLKIGKENCNGTGPSKDELYAKCLKETLNNRALIASMKNAQRFIPDEMLVSSKKRREAKEAELASLLVPIRRRDRLEEMLLLENQARLREEMRVRAERRALGLPEDDVEPVEQTGDEAAAGGSAHSSDKAPSTTSSQRQRRLGSGGNTPSSRCSAEHDLHETLDAIHDIVHDEPDPYTDKPLTRQQVFKLRKLVHEQAKKSRKQVEECPNQPHLCPHCFAVNVQGKHLCPQMAGSVAFRTTGKVINPGAGTKFGTKDEPNANGQYSDNMDSNMLGRRARIHNFNTHPYGTGVVFLPVQQGESGPQSQPVKTRNEFYGGRNEPIFNNNIGDNQAAESDLQYPGSTYNVYDSREGAYGSEGGNVQGLQIEGTAVENAGKQDALGRQYVDNGGHIPSSEPMKQYKTTSALWRTTNQDRELDMERFLEFQKGRMNATSKQVYGESASRFGPEATAQENK